jgi:hypothetical protein
MWVQLSQMGLTSKKNSNGENQRSRHATPTINYNHFDALMISDEIQMANFYPPKFDEHQKILSPRE